MYRRTQKQYLPEEFKKVKSPKFDREMNKSQYPNAWLPGMNKISKFHDYSKNMNSKISNFSRKGKVDI